MLKSILAAILVLFGGISNASSEQPKAVYTPVLRDYEASSLTAISAITSLVTSTEIAISSPETVGDLEIIAKCESGGFQFRADGSVVRGKINSLDVGKFQVNLFYHGEKAEQLGYDLFTEAGNTSYALWLYKNYGTKPWYNSYKCWKDKIKL